MVHGNLKLLQVYKTSTSKTTLSRDTTKAIAHRARPQNRSHSKKARTLTAWGEGSTRDKGQVGLHNLKLFFLDNAALVVTTVAVMKLC